MLQDHILIGMVQLRKGIIGGVGFAVAATAPTPFSGRRGRGMQF